MTSKAWNALPRLCSFLFIFFISLLSITSAIAQTALIGDQAIESNLDTNVTGLAEAFPATASASGQVGSIRFFLDESSVATKIYVGIYSDAGGKPGALLTQGSSTQLSPGTWNSAPVPSVNLSSGVAYWIAILGASGPQVYFRDRSTTACHSQTSSQSTLTSLPAAWTTGQTWNTCYISAYAVTGSSSPAVIIGNQAVESYLDKNPAGRAEAFPATANSTASVGIISLYLDQTSGSGPVMVGLYADNSGHPGTLLGQGSTSNPVAGNWNQIAIAASSLSAGKKYWIAVLGTQATSPYFRDRQTTACHSETTPQSTLTALPATWSTGTVWNTCYVSAYGLAASGSPVLALSSSTLSFAAIQGGANPVAANINITNTGTGTLSFTDSSDSTWLSATPASGSAPQTLQVSASVGSLTAGTYTGHVIITAAGAQNSPATVTATFTVSPFVPPSISASASPGANANGWNNSNVTVTFTCTAGSYPILTCPTPVTVTTEGANQSTCGQAVDSKGNSSASACEITNLDKTPPTITATVTPTPVGGINYGSATVTFACSDSLSGIASCPSPVTDTTIGANQNINGNTTDKAGNSSTANVTLNIQAALPPTVVATPSPTPNSAGWNNSNVTVTFTCTAGSFPVQTCPPPVLVSAEGANQSVCGQARDTQGNASASACAKVSVDKTPPTIAAALSPAPNSSQWEVAPVTVTFSCADSLSGVATCPPSIQISTDGANQSVPGTAADLAGNTATTSATVNLEQGVPTISAFVSPPANAAGWNNSPVTITFTCNQSVSAITSCTPSQTVSTPGVGQVITGTLQDQAGKQETTSVTLNIDTTLPSVLQFTAPTQLSPGQSGSATVTVSDVAPIASVVFQLNGSTIGTSTTPPYTINVTAPTTAASGSTLTLTAVVTDIAGNSTSANKGIQVVSAGVIVGQVLSDSTGLPLAGASLNVIGQSGETATSDSLGKYSIPVTSNQIFLSVTQPANSGTLPAMVSVERQVSVQSGVGTVPVDARMTAIAAPTTINASGGIVGSGAITVTVPPGGATTSFNLTPLSPQGLPGLLPLGWSPVAAFDLRTNITTSLSLSANFTGLPSGSFYLVSYSYSIHAWNMVTPNLTASNGSLALALPAVGDYALVVPDAGNASLQIPAVGQPLTGVPMVTLPANATSSGSLSPANIAPSGGTSMASLAVQSATPLPSGTVIQSEITETYKLVSGQALSQEPRFEDILLFQNPPTPGAAVSANFPVTPSQTFQVSQLSSGDVHMDILSGRESARGQTGGSDAVSVQSGDATVTIAAGSLPQDTAIAVTPETIDTFLPSTSTQTPLSEYNVDFSGQTLTAAAQLSVGLGGATPGSDVVIAQIQRVAGVPFLVVVGTAQVTSSGMVSQSTPGLPGIVQGGDYVFYQISVPTGFVTGVVSSSSGPVTATVQTDALPFVAFAGSNGSYTTVAAAGTVHLSASVPNTALAGTTTAQVVASQTATANLTVTGQMEGATVTPANGALGVPLTAEIDITAADAFNPASVTSTSVVLTAAGNPSPIALRFVFSAGGTKLAVFPLSALQPSTQYTLQPSSLASSLGGLISVPTTSFTTAAITAPTYNTNALVFGMPDNNGNVSITAPANSFPAGSTILIVDQTNGIVYSLTVFNDGSVSGQMPATINDILQVTLTDPAGKATNFTISQFVAPDGTTAVGSGGGTVNGPGGVSMIIPAGALPQGTTFQIQSLDASAFSELPSFGSAVFGGGMQITAPSMPTFNKEVKLAFPVPPNAPPGAFYYVYRQITDQNNNVYFETIDHAFVQGTGASAQVVTASPPFCGYVNSYSNFQASASASFSPLATAITKTFFMWDWDPNQPGTASQGLIVGRILQTVVNNGQTTYVPYTGQATVQLTYPPFPIKDVSIWNPPPACGGTFTILDPHFGGGSRSVTATINGKSMQSTAYEVNGIQVDDTDYDVTAGLELLYKNIGRVTFTVPPTTPPPPPPQINIGIFNASTNQPVSGIVQTGTALTITFSSNLTVQSAAINGIQCDGIACPTLTNAAPPANATPGMNYYQLGASYTPGSPGPYSISATAINPLNLTAPPVTVTQGFLAVQAGGSNNTVTSAPPIVISTTPANNAQGVSPLTFPEIVFSEPVTNVAGNISLLGTNIVPTTNVPDMPSLNLIGVRADGTIANPVLAGDSITSVTIQPTSGLQFADTYTLTLSNAIVDANGRSLVAPTNFVFSTFQPFSLGTAASAVDVLTRPVVIGNYAYVGALASGSSVLSGPDVVGLSDPEHPKDYGLAATFVGRVTDAAGQANSPVPGGSGGLLALSASFAQDNFIPSNIWLYGINPQDGTQLSRVGAVSATSSATQAGVALRLSMLDQYLYSSTFLQGLQVIDLNQAVQEYQQIFTANPTQFGEAVSTDGDGFGMDAIVNTIPLPILSNNAIASATEFDLKAAYFATGGSNAVGATQPLIVATGRLPLLVADPSAGSSGVLFPPFTSSSLGNVLTDSALQLTTNGTIYSLTNGVAVDVGTLPVSQNGTTVNKTIAVLVGTGTVNGNSEPLLAVVDISQPYVPNSQPPYTLASPYLPQPISFFQLGANPTDVILDVAASEALVGTGSNVLIVNLNNPSQPVSGGQITGSYGSRLALDSQGFLVAAGNIPSSSVQLASTIPAVIAQGLPPIFAAITQGDSYGPAAQQQYQLLSDTTITVTLNIPPTKGIPTTGNIAIINTLTNAPVVSTQSLNFVTSGTTAQVAQVTLKAGTFLPPSLKATPAITSQPGILSVPAIYTVGTAAMLLDLDNNTRLDPQKDRPKLNPSLPSGVKFGFWQADPTIQRKQEGLTDFAQIQLKLDALPTPAQGKLYLELQGNAGTPNWALTDNVSVPLNTDPNTLASNQKLYLSADPSTPESPSAQLQLTSASPVDCSSGGGTNSPVRWLCQSDNTGSIELTNLAPGTYTLLFSCTTCPMDPTRAFQLAVVGGTASGQTFPSAGIAPPGVVEKQFVDIRPIQNWVSVFSARESDPPPAVPTAPSTSGWSNTVPQGGNVTVLVHGYDVSESDALTQASASPMPPQGQAAFVPALTKRMYWAAFPMLSTQMVPTSAGNVPAYTVAFLWKGDFADPNLALIAPLFFSDDLFRALESGTPLANLLTQLSSANSQVQVIAHSLGNMVVNSALTQVSEGAVETYVMNEAAVPAEAFFTDSSTLNSANTSAIAATNPFLPGFLTAANSAHNGIAFRQDFQSQHLAQMGQTSNSVWTQLLAQVKASSKTQTVCVPNPPYGTTCTTVPGPLAVYESFYNVTDQQLANPNQDPEKSAEADYTSRWQFLQGQNYGPWLGYFASNLQKTNVFNSYNHADCIVDFAWLFKQLVQSPDRPFSDLVVPMAFGDSLDDLNYAFANPANPFPTSNLVDNLNSQLWLYQPPSSPTLYGDTANYWRWSRLAYWYPAASTGVGAFDFSDAFGSSNTIPLTQYAGAASGLTDNSGNPTGTCYQMPNYVPPFNGTTFAISSELQNALSAHTESHGYLRGIPFPAIWQGYKDIRTKFYPSIPDPDAQH